MKHINIEIGKIHSYRNMAAKGNKTINLKKKITSEFIDNEDTYEHKNTMNSINSSTDVYKLRRLNTFDCP